MGAGKSGKGIGTVVNTGKNEGPGHLPVFCRHLEICCISASHDDLLSGGVIKELMIAGTGGSAQRMPIWDPKGDGNAAHNV